jgi:small subunit ribosomal protein S6
MATKNPTYDLNLLLNTSTDEAQKKKILTDTEATISAAGEVIGTHDWGVRPTAFEMNKRTDAEYHLIQFHGDAELLESLNHTLRITDGVQRFRIIKLAPGVGAPPNLRDTPAIVGGESEEAAAAAGEDEERSERR